VFTWLAEGFSKPPFADCHSRRIASAQNGHNLDELVHSLSKIPENVHKQLQEMYFSTGERPPVLAKLADMLAEPGSKLQRHGINIAEYDRAVSINFALGVQLSNILHSFRVVSILPPVIQRCRIKNPIEGQLVHVPKLSIGVNLEHRSFANDRQAVLERAEAAGVKTLVLTGTSLRSSRGVLEIARTRWQGGVALYSTAGVHPHNARECNLDTIEALRRLSRHPQVVAIGECGLDYNRDFSPRPIQDHWFEAQLALASELKLPMLRHDFELRVKGEKPTRAQNAVLTVLNDAETTMKSRLSQTTLADLLAILNER
jgi:hypothetical protein